MTREEVIEYWEQFNAEIDDLYDACSDADRDVLVKQREIVEYTISALRQQERFDETNKALTLDELRQMDGEPVWCVSLGAKLSRGDGWYIGVNNWHMGGYGKTWLAYRHKKEV